MSSWGAQILFFTTWLLLPDTALAQGCDPGKKLEDGCVPGAAPVEHEVGPEPDPSPTYDLSETTRVKHAATAGIALTIASIPPLYVSFFLLGFSVPSPSLWPYASPFFGGAALIYLTGLPLLLGSHMKAMRVFGDRRGYRINIAAWIMYALTASSIAVCAVAYALGEEGYTMALASSVTMLSSMIPSVVLGLISAIVGKSMANDVLAGKAQSRPTILPFTSPVPGGFVAGIGGTM